MLAEEEVEEEVEGRFDLELECCKLVTDRYNLLKKFI